MSLAAVLSSGNTRTGDEELTLIPRDPIWKTRWPVLVEHGAGLFARSYLDPTNAPNMFAFYRAIAEAGFLVIAADFGGPQTWCTDVVPTAIEGARLYAGTLGARNSRVFLAPSSMGNGSALRYAADNPAKVAAIVASFPMSGINDFRDNNRGGGGTAAINAAWSLASGSTSSTSQIPARGVIENRTADYAGIPWRAYYSSADTVCPPSTVLALRDGMNAASPGSATAVAVSNSLAHGDSIFGVIPPDDVVAWLKRFLNS